MRVPLPVNISEGDFFCHTVRINDNLTITGGLYTACGETSLLEVSNESDEQQTLLLEQPLEIEHFNEEDYYTSRTLKIKPEHNKKDEQLEVPMNHPEERQHLIKLLKSFANLLHNDEKSLSFTNVVKHNIPTTDSIPVYTKSYRYPFAIKHEIQKQITQMLDQQIIKNSHSPWSAPVWVAPKKPDKSGKQKWRLVTSEN